MNNTDLWVGVISEDFLIDALLATLLKGLINSHSRVTWFIVSSAYIFTPIRLSRGEYIIRTHFSTTYSSYVNSKCSHSSPRKRRLSGTFFVSLWYPFGQGMSDKKGQDGAEVLYDPGDYKVFFRR